MFEMEADGLIGGESGSMEVEKGTKTYDMLVSNAAVGKDIGGYFVYIVREKQGPLGNQHYAQKVKVTVGDADDMKTAVISGISPNDRVIVRSSKQLSDGAKVTINQ